MSFDDDTGLVSMTLEDYRRIAEYKIRVDECKSVYYKMKELYQEEEYEDKGS